MTDDEQAQQQHDLLTWLTVREVMARLDIGRTYAAQLLRTGELRAVRTKLGYLIDPASVDVFERERTEKREKKKPKTPD